jgi:hypothetical protein
MTTFTTEDRIMAEKDGSFTVNVEAGQVTLVNKDLTDEEIMDLWVKHLIDDIHVFARAVLKKARE